MNTKVVTNVRIDKEDWQQFKIIAAERGISANEYLTRLIQEQTIKVSFISSKHTHGDQRPQKKYSLLRPWEISEGLSLKQTDFSEEDKVIYDEK